MVNKLRIWIFRMSILLLSPLPPQSSEACATQNFICKACGQELASGQDMHFVPTPMALAHRNNTVYGNVRVNLQLFENPQGYQFEVITFRKAEVVLHWPADDTFSWYVGYSWIIATCPQCQTHIGWAFQPSDWPKTVTQKMFQQSEHTFFALISSRLLSDFSSTLVITLKSLKS